MQHEFVFDDVFDETNDNEQVYERTVKPLVLRLFERLVAHHQGGELYNLYTSSFDSFN